MSRYYGRDGQVYVLDEKPLARGGEGLIFPVEGRTDLVAKIYKNQKFSDLASTVSNPRGYLHDKIRCMLDMPFDGSMHSSDGRKVMAVAWPQDTLKDDGGTFRGFVMPRLSTPHTIHTVLRPRERPSLFSRYTWKDAIAIGFNLASTVDCVHRAGAVVGDLNASNIMVDEQLRVSLIDADSFNIPDRTGKKVYKCMVGYGEALAPELHGKNLARLDSVFTKESDYFSLAVLEFRLLTMTGDGPFSIALKDNLTADRIAAGECLFVSGRGPSERTGIFRVVDMWPKRLRDLFDRAFDYTASIATSPGVIKRRPTSEEWKRALYELYNQPMAICTRDRTHVFPAGQRQCPWCQSLPAADSTARRKILTWKAT